jgi:1,4-alpha-glucan branching enzyme
MENSTVGNRITKPTRAAASEQKQCATAPSAPAKKRGARSAPPSALLSEHFISGETPVAFAYFNPNAQTVFLAGSFNNWDPKQTAMEKKSDGTWTIELILKPGTYEYRLIVDGLWQEDRMAARFAPNPFGGQNSVISVTG